MEFGEKLQLLRKERGLTQAELAEQLFVSRAAVSKWESGRGSIRLKPLPNTFPYPWIICFPAIRCWPLQRKTAGRRRAAPAVWFWLIGYKRSAAALSPCLWRKDGRRSEERFAACPAGNISLYAGRLFALIAVSLLWGILLLTLQNSAFSFWQRWKDRGSLALSAAGTLLFMAGRQPYAGAFTLVFLLIKMLLLLKRS